MKTAALGSVSHGTMQEADLISTFVELLEEIVEGEEHRDLIEEADHWLADGDDADAEFILSDLFDALDKASPPYAYFGSHPGDGADYGFWLLEDWQAIFRESGGLEVDDLAAVPADYIGEVLHVNDHGNATLYEADKGALSQIWSVV